MLSKLLEAQVWPDDAVNLMLNSSDVFNIQQFKVGLDAINVQILKLVQSSSPIGLDEDVDVNEPLLVQMMLIAQIGSDGNNVLVQINQLRERE